MPGADVLDPLAARLALPRVAVEGVGGWPLKVTWRTPLSARFTVPRATGRLASRRGDGEWVPGLEALALADEGALLLGAERVQGEAVVGGEDGLAERGAVRLLDHALARAGGCKGAGERRLWPERRPWRRLRCSSDVGGGCLLTAALALLGSNSGCPVYGRNCVSVRSHIFSFERTTRAPASARVGAWRVAERTVRRCCWRLERLCADRRSPGPGRDRRRGDGEGASAASRRFGRDLGGALDARRFAAAAGVGRASQRIAEPGPRGEDRVPGPCQGRRI